MNITELARKVRKNANELLQILPEYGFDIGKRAIKVDNRVARKIIERWPETERDIRLKEKQKEQEKREIEKQNIVKKKVQIPSVLTVRDFAQIIDSPVNIVIKELMKNGVMATLNEKIDFDTASIVADELGVEVSLVEDFGTEQKESVKIKDIIARQEKSSLIDRPPVVVVMGHVDHGKTKLLDAIRKTDVVAGEAGGITQHIGAYQVEKKGQKITFIDTPGHEAFTAMRSRGAKIADVAILVIAANDSIKPQTKEAIKIIQQAELPMIVAINKIDLEDADVDKVKKDLSQLNLIPEDWGGNTICVPISAKAGLGIEDLLETILLVTEMEKEKIVANPNADAVGTIIESHIDKGEGPVATILVQNGTLKRGDQICINDAFYGKVRAMKDYNSKDIDEVEPGTPAKIIGLKYSPEVGDIGEVKCDINKKQRKVNAFDLTKDKSFSSKVIKTKSEEEGEEAAKLTVVLRADVLGSLEVLIESLEKLETQDVKVKIVGKGLGNITDNDVLTAESTGAVIFGFNVKPTLSADDLARERKVEIKKYQVIYHLLEDVQARIKSLKKQEVVRKVLGKFEVLAIFRTENKSMIVGGRVLEGKIESNCLANIYRKGTLAETGKITEVKCGKEAVREVVSGQECGLNFEGPPVIQVNDILELYIEVIK